MNLRGATTNQNFIQEEIKQRPNSGSACYHSVLNLVFSSVIEKFKKLEYTRLILPVVLYGERLRVLENGAENIWTKEG
jgi:hypothetical protein